MAGGTFIRGGKEDAQDAFCAKIVSNFDGRLSSLIATKKKNSVVLCIRISLYRRTCFDIGRVEKGMDEKFGQNLK